MNDSPPPRPGRPTLSVGVVGAGRVGAVLGAALRDAGITVSLGTDNVPISLWLPVQQTIVRKDYKSGHQVGAKQSLSRMEALRCATLNGAYLSFDEAKKGSLEAGKFADLAVLSADPLTVAEDKISETTALMTMVGGRIMHETPGWSG